jgi:hypothetical protein
MRLILVLLTFSAPFLVAQNSALAIEDADIARCAALKSSVERLQCYDELASAHKLDQPEVSRGVAGQWQVKTEIASPVAARRD